MLINLVDWVPQQEQAAVLFSDWLFAILSGKRCVFFSFCLLLVKTEGKKAILLFCC